MKIDNPFNLLLEAAQGDIGADTESTLKENEIVARFDSIEECTHKICIDPAAVPVFQDNNNYVVEMNAIAGYMKSNDIKNIEEALDNVAIANDLGLGSVGLLVESNDEVAAMLEKANTKGSKAKSQVLDKIKKSTDVVDKLKKKGYPVLKKKSESGCPVVELITKGGSPIKMPKDEGCCGKCK